MVYIFELKSLRVLVMMLLQGFFKKQLIIDLKKKKKRKYNQAQTKPNNMLKQVKSKISLNWTKY